MTIYRSIRSRRRASSTRLPACLAVAIALLVAVSASAQNDQGQARRQARELVNRAQAAEKRGQFDEAAELHKRAYVVMPHPSLVFNIAQAYRRAGKKRRAYFYYRTYLDQVKKGRLARISRRYAAAIDKEIGPIDLKAINEELAREAVGSQPERPEPANAPVVPPPAEPPAPPPPERTGPPPPPKFDAPPPPPASLTGGAPAAPRYGSSPPARQPSAPQRAIARTAKRLFSQPHRSDDAFDALAPFAPRNAVSVVVVGSDLGEDVDHANLLALLSGRLTFAHGFGGTATIPVTQTAIGPDEDESTNLGNIEVGATYTIEFSRQRFQSMAAVALPTNTIKDEDVAGLEAGAYIARVLGDITRLELVVPGLTTFRFGSALQGGSHFFHYRAAAEIGLVSGAPGGTVMARFDGDVGVNASIFSLTLGSITRVGGVLGDVAERDKSALQTLGGTLAVRLTDVSVGLTAGAPVVALGDVDFFLCLGVSLNLDHLAK